MQPLERHRSIEGMTALEVSDREPWRAWLATHHASEAEVWLVYYKGAQAKDGIGYGESVEEALCFGWIDGLVRRIDDDRYMRRFTPRKPKSKWSASNKVRVERLLEEGRMATPGIDVQLGPSGCFGVVTGRCDRTRVPTAIEY